MKEKNFLRYRINFKFLSLAYVSFLQTSKKKIIFLLLLRTKNFHRAEREKERNVIIITSQKKDEKNARRGKPKFVIGLCIFRAETFRRRKEEGMKGEREREGNKPREKCVMDLGQEWSSWNQASRAKTANVPRKVASRR